MKKTPGLATATATATAAALLLCPCAGGSTGASSSATTGSKGRRELTVALVGGAVKG